MGITEQLREVFFEEQVGYVQRLGELLAEADTGPSGGIPSGGSASEVGEALRLAHNLRWAANAAEISELEREASRLEAALKASGEGGEETLDAARASLAAIERAVEVFVTAEPPDDLPSREDPPEEDSNAPEVVDPAEGLRVALLEAFQVESREHLEEIRAFVADTSEAACDPAALREAYRRAHSLKGAARACDLSLLADVTHELESVFSRIQDGGVLLDREVVSCVNVCMDWVEDVVEAEARDAGPSPAPPEGLLDRLQRLQTSPSEPAPSATGPSATGPSATGATAGSEDSQAVATKPAVARDSEDNGLNALLLEAFEIESNEHLESIREFLGSCPAYDVDALNEAYRCAHSLKGAARACTLRAVEKLAHHAEALFAAARDDGLTLEGNLLEAIERALDMMEDCGLEDPDPNGLAGCPELLVTLERLLSGGDTVESSDVAPDATVQESERAEAETARPRTEVVLAAEACKAEVPSTQSTSQRPVRSHGIDTVRVHSEDLDRILHSTGQVLAECQEQSRLQGKVEGLGCRLLGLQKEWEFLRRSLGRHIHRFGDDPVLSSVAEYLDLQDRELRWLRRETSELMQEQKRGSSSLRALGYQLEGSVRRARMVPTESVFQGFRKMVRDLARDEGKEIEFRASGLQAFVDRMVLQALKDPVMHMLRNAISHGLEDPGVRDAAGKPRVGTLTFSAEVIGDRFQVSIDDDGRGVNFDDIRKKAVATGVPPEKAAAMPPEDLVGYIFQAGFSTAASVSDLSGRGMGLSVVHEAVNALQGGVTLQAKEGPGTCFVISVPLSFATHRVVVVRLHRNVFALPVHAVEKLVRVPLSDTRRVGGRLTVPLDDRIVSVLSLAHVLGMDVQEVCTDNDLLSVIVISTGMQRVALAVDAFLDQRDAVIQRLDLPAGRDRRLAGAVQLEDLGLALVLNPSELIACSSELDCVDSFKSRGEGESSTASTNEPSTVLVVDDSFTTRTLETGILETQGYNVVIAADGIEGLNKLRTHDIDLVITDIEMPRMDGFDLVAAMKQDAELSRTPIIMVSSLHSQEVQQRGLDVGADAYIVKGTFDHQDLLDAVEQLL